MRNELLDRTVRLHIAFVDDGCVLMDNTAHFYSAVIVDDYLESERIAYRGDRGTNPNLIPLKIFGVPPARVCVNVSHPSTTFTEFQTALQKNADYLALRWLYNYELIYNIQILNNYIMFTKV